MRAAVARGRRLDDILICTLHRTCSCSGMWMTEAFPRRRRRYLCSSVVTWRAATGPSLTTTALHCFPPPRVWRSSDASASSSEWRPTLGIIKVTWKDSEGGEGDGGWEKEAEGGMAARDMVTGDPVCEEVNRVALEKATSRL